MSPRREGAGRPPLSPGQYAVPATITLTTVDWQWAEYIGLGNISLGVRLALDQTRSQGRAIRRYVVMWRVAGGQGRWQAVLQAPRQPRRFASRAVAEAWIQAHGEMGAEHQVRLVGM